MVDDLAEGRIGSNWPDLAGQSSGSLLIVGPARCVWDDLETVHPSSFEVMAINDIGIHLPMPIEHWFSCHGDRLHLWRQCRKPRFRVMDRDQIKLHTCIGSHQHVHTWPWPGHGSSGLNAIYTGLALGYDNIVLAGVPLDSSGHYFNPPDDHPLKRLDPRPNWSNFENEGKERVWLNARDRVFHGRVKSLSGRTRDWLGSP